MSLFRESWKTPQELTPGERYKKDALADVNFQLEVEGLVAGWFTGMSGGDMEIAQIKHDVTYETGDSTTFLIPGPTTFSPITLAKGFGDYNLLYNWFAAASGGDINWARRNGTITLAKKENGVYTPKVQWNFTNAWPQKLSSYSYNAYVAAKTAQFKITIVPESIEWVEV